MDLLLSRYNNLGYVMSLDIEDGVALINKAFVKHHEDRMFTLYAARYPWFTEDTFVSFAEFYKPKNEVTNNQTAEEIIEGVEQMYTNFQWEVGET